jgi:hypothetical protein
MNVHDRDARAFERETTNRVAADAGAGAAGDEGDLVFKIRGHPCVFLLVVLLVLLVLRRAASCCIV